MKTSIIILLVAIAAGAAAGGTLAYREYEVPPSEFGPFSPERLMTAAELQSYLSSVKPIGFPKVEVVGGNEFDFGVMRRNAEGAHQFVIKNAGTAELELKVTGSTCKCTVGSLQNTTLAPGESTVVDMEWVAKTQSRVFSQSATLMTNDPAAGEVSLVIRGNVVDMVAAEPSSWNLGDLAVASPIHLETTLFNYSKEPMEIREIGWLDERFDRLSEVTYERREVDPASDGMHAEASEAFDVSIDVRPGMPQGRLHQTLRVEYRSVGETESHPPLEVILTGRLVGAISILGGARLTESADGSYRLELGVVEPGEVREERVHVLLRGPLREVAKLRVGEIDPAAALEAELGEVTERASMHVIPLIVRTKPDAPEVTLDGTNDGRTGLVTIESDHPEVAPVRVRVVFRVGQPFGAE